MSWAEWSARNHGAGWDETRARYWRSSLRIRRCVWCWRGGRLDLNHLTYALSRDHRRYGPGWVPAWARHLVLVPMCRRCHELETWLTRYVVRRLIGRRWAHTVATLAPPLAFWSGVGLTVWALIS